MNGDGKRNENEAMCSLLLFVLACCFLTLSQMSETKKASVVTLCCVCQKGSWRKLEKCDRCRKASYCSTTCQELDWPDHKQECRLPSKPEMRISKINGRIVNIFDSLTTGTNPSIVNYAFVRQVKKFEEQERYFRLCLESKVTSLEDMENLSKQKLKAALKQFLRECVREPTFEFESSSTPLPFLTLRLYALDSRKYAGSLEASRFSITIVANIGRFASLMYRKFVPAVTDLTIMITHKESERRRRVLRRRKSVVARSTFFQDIWTLSGISPTASAISVKHTSVANFFLRMFMF